VQRPCAMIFTLLCLYITTVSLVTNTYSMMDGHSIAPWTPESNLALAMRVNNDLLVENREIFIPHLYLALPKGVSPSEFREDI